MPRYMDEGQYGSSRINMHVYPDLRSKSTLVHTNGGQPGGH